MVNRSRNRRPNLSQYLPKVGAEMRGILLGFLVFFVLQNRSQFSNFEQVSNFKGSSSSPSSVGVHRYDADESCKALPPIRPSGSYFLDTKISKGTSPDGVVPSFNVGSIFQGDKVHWHMGGDVPAFTLLKELLEGKEGGLVFDIGANQGFFTYYLAALGMEVHSFEINLSNFVALQHGAEFNPSEVSKRVNLYPVGLGGKNARFAMSGQTYEGFLAENKEGSILGASFDCFAYHVQDKIDLSEIAFVKLDVEGFETAVLQGAQNSLFKHSNIGGFLIEVGPNRWSRASVDFDTGLGEMLKLAQYFKNSYIMLRKGDTCPQTLAEGIISKGAESRMVNDVQVVKVKMNEWEPLLKKMQSNDYDCNFFYRN